MIDYLKLPLTYVYPDYLLDSSLPSDYSSKKAAIISLIELGCTNEEIAIRTDTTKRYVAKIRSIHKAAKNSLNGLALFADESSGISPADAGDMNVNNDGAADIPRNEGGKNQDNNNKDSESKDRRGTGKETIPKRLPNAASTSAAAIGRNMSNIGQGGYYNDPVGKEVRKILWTAFDARVSLVDIIKEHGFVPEIVEHEYSKFQRAKGVSPTEMQGVVIRKINESRDTFAEILAKEKVGEYDKIVGLYTANGSISAEQFSVLLEIYRQIEFFRGKESILNDGVSEPLIMRWVRPKCYRCGKPLPAVIYDASRNGIEYIKEIARNSEAWAHYLGCP
jgi:hypothetical protein